MKIWKSLLLSIPFVMIFVSSGFCTLALTSIKPDIVAAGDEVVVDGSGFKATNLKVSIDAGGVILQVTPTIKSDSSFTFKAPTLESSSKSTVTVTDGVASKTSPPFSIYSNSYIKEAVIWKNKGMSDTSILEHIAKRIQDNYESGIIPSGYFDGVPIIGGNLAQLRDANFSEDFITKLEGQMQYVTLGMAAIFLPDGANVTTAPMLRIFLTPKSYFKPRFPLMTSTHIFTRAWLNGLREAIDVNIGYTIVTTKNGTGQVNTNFLLAGLSYEMNRAALLNIGAAFPVNGSQDKNPTYYIGVTVDQNFLKAIGLMN